MLSSKILDPGARLRDSRLEADLPQSYFSNDYEFPEKECYKHDAVSKSFVLTESLKAFYVFYK